MSVQLYIFAYSATTPQLLASPNFKLRERQSQSLNQVQFNNYNYFVEFMEE